MVTGRYQNLTYWILGVACLVERDRVFVVGNQAMIREDGRVTGMKTPFRTKVEDISLIVDLDYKAGEKISELHFFLAANTEWTESHLLFLDALLKVWESIPDTAKCKPGIAKVMPLIRKVLNEHQVTIRDVASSPDDHGTSPGCERCFLETAGGG